MNKKRIGIIGAGGMANTRAKILKESEDIEIAYICAAKEDEERLRKMASDYNTSYIFDWQDLVKKKDVDAVTISVPNYLHAPISIAAMKEGKDVLVEYPPAISLSDAEEMVRIAKETKRVLHIGLTMRLEGQNVAMKEQLPSLGEMITVYEVYNAAVRGVRGWYRKDELRGDLFSTLHYHFIDQYQELFGSPLWVDVGLWERRTNEDLEATGSTLLLEYKNGASAAIQFFFGCPPVTVPLRQLIVCEKGYLEYRREEEKLLKVTEKDKEEINFYPRGDAYPLDTKNFIAEITGRKEITYPPETARDSLKVSFAAERSRKEKKRIYL